MIGAYSSLNMSLFQHPFGSLFSNRTLWFLPSHSCWKWHLSGAPKVGAGFPPSQPDGQLFIANQASATSKDVLQEHKVGFIASRTNVDQQTAYDDQLVVWNIFFIFHILGIITPTDFHIFERGWNHQPVMINDQGSSMMIIWLKLWWSDDWVSWNCHGWNEPQLFFLFQLPLLGFRHPGWIYIIKSEA